MKGLCVSADSRYFMTAGDEKNVFLYFLNKFQANEATMNSHELSYGGGKASAYGNRHNDAVSVKPDEQFISKTLLSCLDLSLNQVNFVTGGDGVELWDIKKSLPVERFHWGSDTITRVKFNPVEQHLILATSLDRGIFLHDVRSQANLAKVTTLNKSSAICWNPQEPFNFVAGNEDGNAYTFDMRKLETAKKIHKDHIGAM